MAMIVQHNMSAMNANRMLGITNSSLAKSTEKLSSGYKINRAADDAAGLSISEKMRSQIRGLNSRFCTDRSCHFPAASTLHTHRLFQILGMLKKELLKR